MKFSTRSVLCAAALAGPSLAQDLPLVSSEALQAEITTNALLAGEQTLYGFAQAYPGVNRVFGSPGHNDTVNYLFKTLSDLGTYDVSIQAFEELFSGGSATLATNGEEQEANLLTYTPNGNASAPLVAVNNLGCDVADFPPEVSGAIALISRGNCTFAIKSTNAATAGAAGALVYNNVKGPLAGTLGGPGEYVPTVGLSQAAGTALLDQIQAGTVVTGDLSVNSILENRTTYNVIAETKGGDHENVVFLGAHTDSVEQGPGINDDGSGTIGNLEVAKALSRYSVTNAVRFGFWTAEEFGLLGSTYYVSQLNQSAEEIAKVRLYLNFDMIASPNFYLAIYDGDGSSFNLTGPPGSAQIEKDFQDYYISQGQNYTATAFDGRSDYGAFLENNIPAGGLFTGAEGIKTEEEAAQFGGTAGAPYDPNYHQAGDTVDNLDLDAFLLNTKSIANSVAKYALDLSDIPAVTQPVGKRAVTSSNVESVANGYWPQGARGLTQ